jgi:hypothetical protein
MGLSWCYLGVERLIKNIKDDNCLNFTEAFVMDHAANLARELCQFAYSYSTN